MLNGPSSYAQLLLRIAVAGAFLSAVADRFGLWGPPGAPGVVWGSWEQFVAYSINLNAFLPEALGTALAITATGLEIILALQLLVGYRTHIAAFTSALLLAAFALAMTLSFGVKAPFDYSVWTSAAACCVLASLDRYRLSIDDQLNRTN